MENRDLVSDFVKAITSGQKKLSQVDENMQRILASVQAFGVAVSEASAGSANFAAAVINGGAAGGSLVIEAPMTMLLVDVAASENNAHPVGTLFIPAGGFPVRVSAPGHDFVCDDEAQMGNAFTYLARTALFSRTLLNIMTGTSPRPLLS